MPATSSQLVGRARQISASNNGDQSIISGLGTGTHVSRRHRGVSSYDEYVLPVPLSQVNWMIGRNRRVVDGMPDHSMVNNEVMIEERDRGGSPAPRNALNISVITLDETTDAIDTEGVTTENESVVEVMQELANSNDDNYYDVTSSNEDDNDHDVDFGYEFIQGVPPLNLNYRMILERNRQGNEDEDAITNNTIDLTDSPPRHSQILNNASPRQEQSGSSPALNCPVCMENLLAIRRRGSRLVSTICGHVFCGKCLPHCVRTRGHCPTCRTNIGYEDFHPLYLF